MMASVPTLYTPIMAHVLLHAQVRQAIFERALFDVEEAKQHTSHDHGPTASDHTNHDNDPQRLLYLEALRAVHAASDEGVFAVEDQQLATCAADYRYGCLGGAVVYTALLYPQLCAPHRCTPTCMYAHTYSHATSGLQQTTRALQALHVAHSWQQQLQRVDTLMSAGVALGD